jgi:hypothetical protein
LRYRPCKLRCGAEWAQHFWRCLGLQSGQSPVLVTDVVLVRRVDKILGRIFKVSALDKEPIAEPEDGADVVALGLHRPERQ